MEDKDRSSIEVCWPYFVGSDNPIPYLFEKIAPYFANTDFRITVFSEQRQPVIDQKCVREIYAFESNTLKRRLKVLRTLADRYDILHTGGSPGKQYSISRVAHLRNDNLAYIHTFRIDQLPRTNDLTKEKQWMANEADIVTAVSRHTAKTITDRFGRHPEVIYNGVDTDIFAPEYPQPPLFESLNVSTPIFLFVGSLRERKQPAHVLEVAKQVPEASFVIVGNGPQYSQLAEAAGDNVHVVGRVDKERLPAIYANSSGFIFPSKKEGCPNVVLEAMASEIPVIGYEATSMPELITPDETGYLASPNHIDELSELVRTVIDSAHSRKIGENAREYVINNHTFDIIASEYLQVYRSLVEQ